MVFELKKVAKFTELREELNNNINNENEIDLIIIIKLGVVHTCDFKASPISKNLSIMRISCNSETNYGEGAAAGIET